MKNTTGKNKAHGYPSKESRWAYYMQAIEPTSQELNDAFPGYHPQWLQLSQKFTISPAHFKAMRESLGLSVEQCAAYLRTSSNSVYKWERGDANVPFPAFELLRVIRESVSFKTSHPKWEGWFINERGVMHSPNIGGKGFTPEYLEWVSWQGTEAGKLRGEVSTLQAKLDKAVEENTNLRQMFVAHGVVDELAAMQNTINDLMVRIATAKVLPFVAPSIQVEQLKEKTA
ncbi:MAG: hypothetical protein M0P59_01325 [Gallionella sp.]|jgi:transcriptional regulator with XRE-family HTH domain|nr:hypothetical protein [Gallionella sp.]MCK9352783.1 hypothetical protein [Gallionella sp.]